MILTDSSEFLSDATAKFRAYRCGVEDFLTDWQSETKAVVRSELLQNAILAFEAVERFDLAVRRRLSQSSLSDSDFSRWEAWFDIFSKVWLTYSEQLATQLETNTVEPSAPVARFVHCLSQMRSIVRCMGRAEFAMTPELVEMQNAALAENRDGQTEPLFSFEE